MRLRLIAMSRRGLAEAQERFAATSRFDAATKWRTLHFWKSRDTDSVHLLMSYAALTARGPFAYYHLWKLHRMPSPPQHPTDRS